MTLVCSARARIFQREANAKLLIATLYRYRAEGRFPLHGFVVMPDHMHLLLSPAAALEQVIGLIKGGFSFAVHKQHRGPVWQESYYSHRVLDGDDFRGQLAYVAANPERRRMEGYPFVHTQEGYEVDPALCHLSG